MLPISTRPFFHQIISSEGFASEEGAENVEIVLPSSEPDASSPLQISLQAASLQNSLNPKKKKSSAEGSTSTSIASSPIDEIVSKQFEELVDICNLLSKKEGVTLQNLLNLSWGIGSIPKDVKFSKWGSRIEDRHWLLLEDICRQIANGFSDTADFNTLPNEWQVLANSFPAYARELKEVLQSLIGGPHLSRSGKTHFIHLDPIKVFFEAEFDQFILGQVQINIKAINTALEGKEAIAWLQEGENIKALFRTIEVIGEASKIISDGNRQRLPTLAIKEAEGGGATCGTLWGKLRNQLHHHKSRSMQIAILAPEKWVKIIENLFPRLLEEISSPPSSSPTPIDKEDIDLLSSLNTLCSQEHYRHVQNRWRQIESDFNSPPLMLKRFLFGLDETLVKKSYSEIWEVYAKPFLKSGVNEKENEAFVFDLFRLRSRNCLTVSDIDRLTSGRPPQNKDELVTKLKEIIAKTKANQHTEAEVREFEFLVDQLVFFKKENSKIGCDKSKNEALKKLLSQCLSQSKRTEFSEATFLNPDGSLTDYGLLLTSYIELKNLAISKSIAELRRVLDKIKGSWPAGDLEGDLTKSSAVSFAQKAPKGEGNLKQSITTLFESLCKELLIDENFPQTGDFSLQQKNRVSELIKKIKLFPTQRIAKNGFLYTPGGVKLAELKDDRKNTAEAITALIAIFDNLQFSSLQIQDKVDTLLNRAIEIYNMEHINDEEILQLRAILNLFSFHGNTILLKQLAQADLPPPNLKEKKQSDLNSLQQQLLNSSKARLVTDFDQEINQLTTEASNELAISFVQKILYSNPEATSIFHQEGKENSPLTLKLLGDIYSSSLHEDEKQAKLSDWKNVERRLTSKLLPIEQYEEVVGWLPKDDSSQEKKSLLDYLNGLIKFEIKDCSPFDYPSKKVELFEKFLNEEFFLKFPHLQDKRATLLTYFKTAYGIVETNQKSNELAEKLKRKINNLGKTFAKVLEGEREGKDPKNLKILLLAAEYDLQDIGELAKLITEKDSFWDSGCHILSSSHLFSIALMRKMMAHYPLHLTSDTLRWNLEYLAFDTNSHFSYRREVSENIEMTKKSNRRQITHRRLKEQVFEIKDLADRLNLKLDMDVLHPSIDEPQHSFVHPFGDFSIMVYPTPECSSQQEFVYNVMEFELILNHQLASKVCIIGSWEGQLINIPSDKYTPKAWFEKALEKKKNIDHWISSSENYEIFKTKPWTLIKTSFGNEISSADYELHNHFHFFLRTLDLPTDPDGLKQSVERADLVEHIQNRMEDKLNCTTINYSTSDFFAWTCSLYEHFSPPGVEPKALVKLPKESRKERPLVTMIDQNDIGLQFLPEQREETFSPNHALAPYYRDGRRRDIINGRSILNPANPITLSELPVIAEYAADVLRTQIDFLVQKLTPSYGLPPSLFCFVDSIHIGDTTLREPPPPPTEISDDIQRLINNEAKELAPRMSEYINQLGLIFGRDSCSALLNWLKIDKQIDVIAREYYLSNEARLSSPYIQLNPISRHIFDEKYLSKGHLEEFSFVNCYQRFLGEITFEIDSLTLNRDGTVTGDFSSHMKELIPEREARAPLLDLMKKRKIIINKLLVILRSKNPFLEDEIEPLFFKCDKLFRMVHDPVVFDALADCIENDNKANRRKVYGSLRTDFMNQYLSNQYEQSFSIARHAFIDQALPILHVRDYFKVKRDTDSKVSHHEIIDDLIQKPETMPLLDEWEALDSLVSLYNTHPSMEARAALDELLLANDLPLVEDQLLVPPPSYSEYWEFVKVNPISMSTQPRATGKAISFKKFSLGGGSFQNLIDDKVKKDVLDTNPRLSRLIELYITFAPLENALSDFFYYLKQQREVFKTLEVDRESAKQANKDSWVIDRYDEKLKRCQDRIESGKKKFKQIIEKIKKTEFFSLLKFFEKWRAYSLGEGVISNETQIIRVLQNPTLIPGNADALNDFLSDE